MRNIFIFIFILICTSASAENSLIDKIQRSQESFVTIKAQNINPPHVMQEEVKGRFKSKMKRVAIHERFGAGVIIDPNGYIVTNTHVVARAQQIRVVLYDGTETFAQPVSIEQGFDFIVLKISPPYPLKAIEFADSDAVRLGDDVANVGNSSFIKRTISGGKVTGLGIDRSGGKTMTNLIHTNINLYKGDSGGPLLDSQGRLIGLIVAKNKRLEKSSFAVPSNKIWANFYEYFVNRQ